MRRETICLSALSMDSGVVGGGSTHRYYLAGQNMFNVYLYSSFSYNGTEVFPDLSEQDCWCSNGSVTFSREEPPYNDVNDGRYESPKYGSTDWIYAYKYNASMTGISVSGREIILACSPTGYVKTEDTTFRY